MKENHDDAREDDAKEDEAMDDGSELLEEIETDDDTRAAELHLDLGAALELHRGVVAPSAYGDEDAEDEALTAGWAVLHRTWAEGLVMAGEDRLRFLNSQATCEVKDLAAGSGAYGFFVSGKGRVEAEVTVLAGEDDLWLELPPLRSEPIRERLEKYKVVDRVELSPLELTALSLAGPQCEERLAALVGELPPGQLGHRRVRLHGADARLVREAPLGAVPVFSLWLEKSHLEKVLDGLLDQDRGPTLVGWHAWDRLRVEVGRPVFGLDFGEDCFPQETGLEERGVSYTKGCYLGQEVVARIHYRGGVQRHMRRLELESRARTGQELRLDGKKVGVLGTVAPVVEGYLGLGVVHQKAEPGACLDVVDGEGEVVTTAVVVELMV